MKIRLFILFLSCFVAFSVMAQDGFVSGIVRESGGVGSDMNVMLDGFSGKHVKAFIDGVPQEGVGGSFGLNN